MPTRALNLQAQYDLDTEQGPASMTVSTPRSPAAPAEVASADRIRSR